MLSKIKAFLSWIVRPLQRKLVITTSPTQKKWRQVAALGTGMGLMAWMNHKDKKTMWMTAISTKFQVHCATPALFLQHHVWETAKEAFKMMQVANIQSFLNSRSVLGRPTNTMLFTDAATMNGQIDAVGNLEDLDAPIYPSNQPVAPTRCQKLHWLPQPVNAIQVRPANPNNLVSDEDYYIGENVYVMVGITRVPSHIQGFSVFRPSHLHGITVIKFSQRFRARNKVTFAGGGGFRVVPSYQFCTDRDMVEILQRNHEDFIYHIPPI